ncbi:MAG: stress-responsive transcription factor hsf1 [Icmadophila ericetorum]|nr:stress-responsive transcription factor hsf1 [Icmadophila ericetorum]
MPQAGSRKRPAPGTSPAFTQPAQLSTNINMNSPQMPNEQILQWGPENGTNPASTYPDSSTNFGAYLYNSAAPAAQATSQEPSNQLARRPMNQHVVTRGNFSNGEQEAWPGFASGVAQKPRQDGWTEEDERLEQKALAAKRDAQAKRKMIPPFVQKLSSFLEESRNTDLIRWSQNGDSFIVVDEDEFARTLIPELFKHKNYPSFVRQLNMYGFHKKVGLSDNSMRASEKKNKSPSEYYNQYFRQGRPNLLWLITKPKSSQGKGKGGRSKQDENNMDDGGEDVYEVDSPAATNHGTDESVPNRGGRHLMIGQGGLPQEDLAAVQRELTQIRQHQQIITNAIQKIRRDHEQQAAAFQELHNRHANSINAILTFLATVYNRSLEGHNAQNLANLFGHAIPNENQNSGNVVDLGDYTTEVDMSNGQPPPRWRQPLLLKAPPVEDGGMSRGTTASPAASASTPAAYSNAKIPSGQGQASYFNSSANAHGRTGTVEEIFDQNGSASSPHFDPNDNSTGQLPERDIMSFINNANANNSFTRMDFPQALSHLQTADGKSPLTMNQRNNVLQLMANGTANGASGSKEQSALSAALTPNSPLPDIQHWNATDELDFLERTLKEQDSKVANLSTLLQPLSPSGSIPGLNDPQGYTGHETADPLDLDQIFNSGDYFNDASNGAGINFGTSTTDFGNDTDFNFDHYDSNGLADSFGADTPDTGAGRVVETFNSSEGTSPATVDDGATEGDSSPRKRTRRS